MPTRAMYWKGRDVETLSREELIEVVRHLGQQIESASETHNKLRRALGSNHPQGCGGRSIFG